MLGPLLNPAGAVYGLIGVYSPDISMLMAQSLQQLGTRKALVVHSQVIYAAKGGEGCRAQPLWHAPHAFLAHDRKQLERVHDAATV